MSDGKQYMAGIVGCGRMANLHAEAYTLVPDTQVVAAADIDPDKLDLFCERWSVPQRYRSYEEMLAQADVDIVSVVTLDNLHGPRDDCRGRGRRARHLLRKADGLRPGRGGPDDRGLRPRRRQACYRPPRCVLRRISSK